ncbi:MAG TPA: alpha/beta fold hydrolase [Anaerolineae bacterium]|nr:alpha/beta fold hydrolase [Anaerolineae bacterium]
MPMMPVGDVELYYKALGAGEPVLFLHGLGSSSGGWVLQRDVFAAQYQVILVDARGHGRSDKPPGPYSVPMFTADIVGLLDGLGVTAVHVVGLSMGGMIGFQMAVDYPERVKSLTIINSGPELAAHTFKERLFIWQRKLLLNTLSMEKIGNAIGGRLFPEPEQAEYKDMFVAEFVKNDKAAYKAATNALFGWSVRDRIGQIQCPALVLASDQDYTPVAAKEAYVAEIPDARLVVIENSRHAAPIDQPDVVNTAILNFLAEIGD